MNNDVLSRLLMAQPMDQPMAVGQLAQAPIAQPLAQPATVAQVAVSDAERRRQEIAKREENRQKQAREKLANRQAQNETGPETPMESHDQAGPDAVTTGGYDASDLFGAASARAEGKIGSLDRKPMTEWNKSDWGQMLTDIGGGFASAKDGQFSSGLAGGVKGMSEGLKAKDKRAQEFNDKQLARMEALEDMGMEDQLRQRRTGDERAYDTQVRQGEREFRSGERQQDRLYEDRTRKNQRRDEIADRDESRAYTEGVREKDRAYAESAAAAANQRADAKAMREAAAKNSRDYSSDYVKMATDLNSARMKEGNEPMTAEELDAIIIPQLRQAYGIGALGAAPQNVLPQNQTLGTGY